MADTEQVPRDLFSSDSDDNSSSSRLRNETVSGGVKVYKEDRFGDALVIEDYETGDDVEALQGKGKEIELLPRGKFKIDSEELEFAEAMDEEEESRKARDSHQFQTVQFKMPGTYCDHCGTLIWGISGKQGLKCDVCNYVCHIDCEKKLTKRCRGYKNKVVEEEDGEEAINNLDKDINFYDDLKNIGCHQFYPKMARRTYCNVCRQSVNLVGKQGLRCAICRYVVHSGCAKDAERNCPIPYHVPDTRKEKIPKHHWIEGNIESGGICIYCAKSVTGGSGMTNFQCFWCKGLIHNSCKDKHHKCDLGQHHNLKLPPHVFQRNPDESDPHKWLVDISLIPEDHSKRPLCVLINRMSGARQGASVIRQLGRLLNPMQIVDIAKGGPRFGIEMFSPLCKKEGSFCILGCGGDGTIGWICEELDKLGLPYDERPCVIPLPIGTGNDLSRVLGWGPGYENEDLAKILDDIEVAKEVFMDRWKIRTFMTEENIQAGKKETSAPPAATSTKKKKRKQRSKSNKSNTLTRTWERALNLSKEKVSVTRNLGKFRAKQQQKDNKENKNKERKKRRRNKSKKNNNNNVKDKKVKKVQEVMSDDEGERRKVSRKSLIYDSDDDDEVDILRAKTTTTNETEKIKKKVSSKTKSSSLTRRKATLTKSISLPLIGSGISQPKKKEEDKEALDNVEEEEQQEAKEKKEKEVEDEEEEQQKHKEAKGKEKINEDEEEEQKPEFGEEGLLDDTSVPEDFEGMQFVAQKIYNNYFSVGVDAKVALDFHIARESNPENFKSRNYNKFKYFQYGAVSVLGGCKDLNQKISVVIDGKEAKIPNSVEGVVALNLTSYASGTNPWKNNKPAQEWSEQRFDDGLIEIVGVKGTLHLAQIRTGLSTGVQLGQGKRIVFNLKEPLPVQADGEPWLQQAAVLEITLHNKTKMLQRVQPTTVLGQIMSPSNWFQKKKKIDAKKNTPRDHNEFGVDQVDEDNDLNQNGETSSTTSTPSTPTKKGSSRKKSLKDDQSPLKSSISKKGGEGEDN